MIKNYLITGDTHGRVASRLEDIKSKNPDLLPEETAVIILGDAGINFYLNNSDKKNKKIISTYGYTIYCVRGNHEERPSNLGYDLVFDEEVDNRVRIEKDFPLIRYLSDGSIYNFGGYHCLVIGGAYSIDKDYRLQQAKPGASWTGWFKDEQLTEEEMEQILEVNTGIEVDFILSHTCPAYFEPTDLFLPFIDQSKVDKSMELWLDKIKNVVKWKYYLFGHYHADRIERPYVEQFYQSYESLDAIVNRWKEYDKTGKLDWWVSKSPNFYVGNNK